MPIKAAFHNMLQLAVYQLFANDYKHLVYISRGAWNSLRRPKPLFLGSMQSPTCSLRVARFVNHYTN